MQTMIDLVAQFSEPAAQNWIQIMKTGQWNHPSLGKIKINQADLHQFKENFDNRVRGTDLSVDVSHQPDKGAVAWFKELKVQGEKLLAKMAWTEEGADLVQKGKYRYFSPEFMFKWKDPDTGKEFKDVLFGGAITNRPFLKNMEPIEFTEEGRGQIWMAEDENYSPDDDDDYDTTTNPNENRDWIVDILSGITPWSIASNAQKEKLKSIGARKVATDAAFQVRQEQLKKAGQKTYDKAVHKMSDYDPDHDGDDDSTANPRRNPDWVYDVLAGITPWDSCTTHQKSQLKDMGATKEAVQAAYDVMHSNAQLDDPESGLSFEDREKLHKTQKQRSQKYGISIVDGGHLTPPKGKPTNPDDYADPVNYKYPIDQSHIKAAVEFFNHDGMRKKGGYSEHDWEIIGKRIAKAASHFEGGDYSYSDGKIQTPNNHGSQKHSENFTGRKNYGPWSQPSATHPVDDKDAGKYSSQGGIKMGDQNPEGVVSLEEYNAMQKRIKLLEHQNRKAELKEKVRGFTFDESTQKGKIMPAQEDKVLEFMMGLNKEQVAKFEEFLKEQPDVISFNDESGFGNTGQPKDRDTLVAEKADALFDEGKAESYKEAILMAEDQVPQNL